MIPNATVTFLEKVAGKDSEGAITRSFSAVGAPSIRADVQPMSLSEYELKTYGITDTKSDVRKMFCDPNTYLSVNQRVQVVSDFDSATEVFEVKNVQKWSIHYEALLIPVQGEGV